MFSNLVLNGGSMKNMRFLMETGCISETVRDTTKVNIGH